MKFCELTLEEFEKFSDEHPLKSFFQTKYMYNRYLKENKEVYIVGVKKRSKVIGGSIIVKTSSFRGYGLYEALQGLLLDYKDKELLTFFVKELKGFLKEKKAYKLIINPYIPLREYDNNGVVTDKIDNSLIKKDILSLGFKELKKYDQVKWIYCLDIKGKTEEEVFKSFRSSARNYINKTISKFELELKELKYEELKDFYKIVEDTCLRKGFPGRSLEYFQNMDKAFKNKVKFIICYLNIAKYKDNLREEIALLEKKISNLSLAKANDKKREFYNLEIANNKKYLEEVKELEVNYPDNLLPLAASMFMLYGEEIVYLFSGSYEEYKNFFGQYRIQWEIISYAIKHHYTRYNFYGIKDITKRENQEDGVVKFKRNFNGYILELVGAFEIPINRGIYSLEHIYSNILKK